MTTSTTVDISTKLSNLKKDLQSVPTKISSVKLLDIVIRLYLKHPTLFISDNFTSLKQALYVWCICYPYWNPADLAPDYTPRVIDNVKLTYSQYAEISEAAFQICRFLDFGEMYWSSPKYVWDTQPRTNKNLVINLILEKLYHG